MVTVSVDVSGAGPISSAAGVVEAIIGGSLAAASSKEYPVLGPEEGLAWRLHRGSIKIIRTEVE